MDRERILTVLYDMALAIGGEVSLQPLLVRTLQRLLYHTSFPAGMVFLDVPAPDEGAMVSARLDASLGDYELGRRHGDALPLPVHLLRGPPSLVTDPTLLAALPCRQHHYRACLRLPVGNRGVILLLSPTVPESDLPLEHIFQPVMANLAKAILLCQHNEAYTHALVSDRDRAQSGLERFRAALDTSADCVFLIAPGAMGFLDFNRSAEIQTGYGRAELLARGPQDLAVRLGREGLRDVFADLLGHHRNSVALDTLLRRKDGSEFIASITFNLFAGADGERSIIAVARDITERYNAEATAHLFHEVDRRLLEGVVPEEVPRFVCRRLAEVFDYPLVWLGAKEPDGNVSIRATAGTAHNYLDGLHVRWDDTPQGQGPTGKAIRTRRPQVNRPGDADYAAWRTRAEEYGFRSSVALPVLIQGEVYGALNLYSGHPDAFDDAALSRLEDIAARVSLALQMASDQRLLRLQGAAMDGAANAIFITDRHGVIEWVNPAFTHLSGLAGADAVGRTPAILKSEKSAPTLFETLWQTVLAGRVWRGEMVNRRPDGSEYTVDQTVVPVLDERGEVAHFVSIQEDITARKEAEARVRYMQEFDALTGLPNRTLLLDRLGQALAGAAREGLRVAVIHLDLDRFKNINDTLGQGAGNRLLQAVAARLTGLVPEGTTVSRQGGDEFSFILPGLQESRQAASIARSVLDGFAEPFLLDGHELFITPSLGIAVYPYDGGDPDLLLKNADSAMFRAKERGGNGYEFFTADMTARAAERLTLENSLRRALEREEFELHYQPQVDLLTGTVVGVEALVRWHNPDNGMVSPARFIPVAEETGLIEPLGEWVLATACRQARAWQEQGMDPLRVAVNLSARQLRRATLDATVRAALEGAGLAAEWLELEITESAVMEDPEAAIALLARVKEMGVLIAVDDFGTGYSSLSQIKRFPLDKLKVDQSFVRDIAVDENDAQIAAAIIAMGRSLNLRVIAEGVETPEQLRFLLMRGCDEMQGYYFSRPLPVDALTDLLRERRRLEL